MEINAGNMTSEKVNKLLTNFFKKPMYRDTGYKE